MSANDADLHLDGNAAGGWLTDLFCLEMTTADVLCAGCGALGPVGTLLQFGHEMGIILRCPACDTAVIRTARIRDHYWLDMRGAVSMRLTARPT